MLGEGTTPLSGELGVRVPSTHSYQLSGEGPGPHFMEEESSPVMGQSWGCPLAHCTALGKLIYISEAQFPYL